MTGHREEIARRLNEARLAAGLTLRDIADSLRIKPVYLQAIEAGQFERLPALPQTIGFTRAYAKHLDVDIEAPLTRLGEEVQQNIESVEYAYPEPVWTVSPRRIGYTVAGMVIGAAVLALSLFDFSSTPDEPVVLAAPDRAVVMPPLVAPLEIKPASPVLPRAATAPITADLALQLLAGTSEVAEVPAEVEVAAAPVVETPAVETPAGQRFVTAHVYMRAQPANAGAVLDVLQPCEPLVLQNEDGGEPWLNVSRADGRSGWVYRNYVSGNKPASCS